MFPRRSAAGSAPSPVKHVGTAVVEPPCKVLLQTLPITVHGPAGRCTTHALLDLGSQVTLVTEGLSVRLGISGPIDSSVLSTINGSETQIMPCVLRDRACQQRWHTSRNTERPNDADAECVKSRHGLVTGEGQMASSR